jgi:hypothetical protein
MKSFILSLSVLVSVLTLDQASACSQAPTIYSQTAKVAKVLESDSFKKALNKQLGDDAFSVKIEKIEIPGTVDVTLSNGCVLINKYITTPPSHPGMCPQFKTIKTSVDCE